MTGIESLAHIEDADFVDSIREMTKCFVSQVNDGILRGYVSIDKDWTASLRMSIEECHGDSKAGSYSSGRQSPEPAGI